MKWHRTPQGYLSEDGHAEHGFYLWSKVWMAPIRPLSEIAGIDDGRLFVDTLTEGGWLSEAKSIVESIVSESNPTS